MLSFRLEAKMREDGKGNFVGGLKMSKRFMFILCLPTHCNLQRHFHH